MCQENEVLLLTIEHLTYACDFWWIISSTILISNRQDIKFRAKTKDGTFQLRTHIVRGID